MSDLLKDKNASSGTSPSAGAFQWPVVVATLLVAALAFRLLASQLVWANYFRQLEVGERPNPVQDSWANNPELSLAYLDGRADQLEPITNWVEREHHCIGLAYTARLLDASLDPNARVFVSGMLGPTNLPKAGYYYFLKNYLFPRDVEISLDGKAFSGDDGFHGVPCDSQDVLRSNGFDLLIDFDNNGKLIPLTPKGVPHTE